MLAFWRDHGAGLRPAEARDYLCPLIARSAAEQQRFYAVFDQYAPLLGMAETAEEAEETEEPSAPATPTASPPNRRRYQLLGLALALLLSLGAYFLYQYWFPAPIQGCRDAAALNFNPKATEDCCCEYKPDEVIREEVVGCRDSTAINYNPQATVACEDCCRYEGCMDEGALNYEPRATRNCKDCCQYPAKTTLTALASRDSLSYKPQLAFQAISPPALAPLEDNWGLWLADNRRLFSWIIYGLLLALALAAWLWRRARQQYIARRERGEEPPYRLPIKINKDRPIAVEQEFFLALNRLRGREDSSRLYLDLPRTINATIRNSGRVDFRFQALQQPVEYLLLIDKQAEQNHQSQLFEHLYRRFVRHEVYAVRFFFDGNPQICWNDDHPSGITLERLVQRYRHARLLVLSDGYSFINPATGELESWVEQLAPWGKRALLTPAPAGGWNYREALLARFLVVLPSNVDGMLAVVRHFEGLPGPSLRDWKYEIGKNDQGIEIDEQDVVSALQRHFSPAMMRWLAGCAIYPELHWDLTLELGEALSPPSEPLVSFSNVALLARLPWFRHGYLPDEVREQLLSGAWLPEEERREVREAIIRILEANVPDNPESYAYEEHQMHLAMNKLLVSRLPEEQQRWLEVYRQQHAKGISEDYVGAAELDKRFNQLLDFELPEGFRRLFYREGRRVLGGKNWLPLLLAALLGLLVWGLGSLLPDPCPGQVALLPYTAEKYCLQNPEDSLAFFTLAALQYVDSLNLSELDSMRRQAETLAPRLDTGALENTFFRNYYAGIYNRGLRFYREGQYENASLLLSPLIAAIEIDMAPQRQDGPALSTPRRYPLDSLAADLLQLAGFNAYFSGAREVAATYDTSLVVLSGLLSRFKGRNYAGPYSPGLKAYLQYEFVDSTYAGRTRVRQDGYYGFLGIHDGAGRLPYEHAYNFVGDSALVTMDTRQCYINRIGIIQYCFDRLLPFQSRNTGQWGFENENGIALIPAQYDTVGSFTDDDLAWVKPPGQGYGYIRTDGSNLLRENDLEAARDYRYGLAAVQQNGKYGYLDTRGVLAIPLQYDEAGDFTADGRAQVKKGDKRFTINREGRCVAGDCPSVSVSGRVLDGNTGQPLPGVSVRLGEQTVVSRRETGSYYLEIPESQLDGELPLSFSREGYQPQSLSLRPGAENLLPDVRLRQPTPTDQDGDGVPDAEDACPTEAGLDATQGCPDKDGDGVADKEDQCPEKAGPPERNGCPEEKSDVTQTRQILSAEALAEAGLLPEMVPIPAGRFTMGCKNKRRDGDYCKDDEKPAHDVSVQAYRMGKYEVTHAQFAAFLNEVDNQKEGGAQWYAIGSSYAKIKETRPGVFEAEAGYETHPVVEVSWYGARAYCRWLSEKTGQTYRLPTEAEWEYAARGGEQGEKDEYLYSGSDDIDKVAWHSGNSGGRTHSIAETDQQLQANQLGLYNMSGNVWEWCSDWYDSNYYTECNRKGTVENPPGPVSGTYRVVRGGSWLNYPQSCRCPLRYRFNPGLRDGNVGFRLALPFQF